MIPKLTYLICGTLVVLGTAQASCSTPYYPVKEGLSRTYQTTVAGKSLSYTETLSKVSDSGFTYMNSLAPKMSSTFSCNSKGIVGSGQALPAGMKVTSVRGVTQPPSLKLGTTWTSGMTMKGAINGQAVESSFDIVMKVVGVEKITVKAGTFNTFKVQGTSANTMVMGGKKISQPPAQMTTWIAQGIGTVKSVAANTVTELVKYNK